MRSCESHYLAKPSWLPSQKKVSVRLPTDTMSLVGVEELKEKSQAIRSFVSGRGVFVALPTGYSSVARDASYLSLVGLVIDEAHCSYTGILLV